MITESAIIGRGNMFLTEGEEEAAYWKALARLVSYFDIEVVELAAPNLLFTKS